MVSLLLSFQFWQNQKCMLGMKNMLMPLLNHLYTALQKTANIGFRVFLSVHENFAILNATKMQNFDSCWTLQHSVTAIFSRTLIYCMIKLKLNKFCNIYMFFLNRTQHTHAQDNDISHLQAREECRFKRTSNQEPCCCEVDVLSTTLFHRQVMQYFGGKLILCVT